jgi:hypothetical protein
MLDDLNDIFDHLPALVPECGRHLCELPAGSNLASLTVVPEKAEHTRGAER